MNYTNRVMELRELAQLMNLQILERAGQDGCAY